MRAKSIKGKSPDDIQSAVADCFVDDFKPTLAFVFLSVKQDRKAICKILDEKNIAIFGATTHGEFTDENLERESVVILLLEMNPAHFFILFDEYPNEDYRQVTQKMAKQSLQQFTNPAFLIAGSKIGTDAEELLHGFEDIIGTQVNVYGGMAGDDYTFKEQFVFTHNQSSNQGIIALVLDQDNVMIKGKAACGWKAIGTAKTVTKSEGNHVYTVDDIPVLELTKKYGGLDDLTSEQDKRDQANQIASNFPLQLQREKGDPVMRPGLVIDWNDGSFYCSGSVPQGSKVRFSLQPDLDVIDKVISGAEDLKRTEMPQADAVIVFSCGGRLWSLGPLMTTEIEGIKNVWKAPMAGFFTNAELARATEGNLEMHNLVTCCVALKEK
jgi:hypothetical protein